MPSSTKREKVVTIAAPATPKAGKPNFPKIKTKLPTKLTSTATIPAVIGNTVFPVSLKLVA